MAAHLVAGFLSSLVLIVAIGAQNAFVLRQGLRREHLVPIVAICALSDAALIVAGIAGLGALVQSHAGWLALIRHGGAAFLLVYGAIAARRAWRGGQLSVDDEGGREPLSRLAAIATCLGFTFLNPHVYLDTVVLLGALANERGAGGRWWFGAGAASASLLWFVALAWGAGRLAPLFAKRQAWRALDSLIALVMWALAAAILAG